MLCEKTNRSDNGFGLTVGTPSAGTIGEPRKAKARSTDLAFKSQPEKRIRREHHIHGSWKAHSPRPSSYSNLFRPYRQRRMAVNYLEITETLSASRMRPYRRELTSHESGLPTSEAVKGYFLLKDISQHFFAPLQLVEVAMRNRIDAQVTNRRSRRDWYETVPAAVRTKDAVIRAKDLAAEEVTSPGPDDIVCRLTFGFWANLLDRPHRDSAQADHYIWDSFSFKKVFPGAPPGLTIAAVHDRLLKLNAFRNRLFHHEPVWKGRRVNSLETAISSMRAQYVDLCEVLSWLSPEANTLLTAWSFPGRFHMACDPDRFNRPLW